jgi:hypothetical protein
MLISRRCLKENIHWQDVRQCTTHSWIWCYDECTRLLYARLRVYCSVVGNHGSEECEECGYVLVYYSDNTQAGYLLKFDLLLGDWNVRNAGGGRIIHMITYLNLTYIGRKAITMLIHGIGMRGMQLSCT